MDVKRWIFVAVTAACLWIPSTLWAQDLGDAFPTGHVGAATSLAYLQQSDTGGLAVNPGGIVGFDPWKFATMDVRMGILVGSIGLAARLTHGRPGAWGGVYLGPRLSLPLAGEITPFYGGTLGYEYRWRRLRFALDGSLARGPREQGFDGVPTTTAVLGEVGAYVSWNLTAPASQR